MFTTLSIYLFIHIEYIYIYIYIDTNSEQSTPSTSDTNGEVGSKIKSERERKLLDTTTRLFVLAMTSLLSSIFYQIAFGIAIMEEFTGTDTHNALYYFSFTWGIDNTINVICLFFSTSFAKAYYHKLCCCDICCLKIVQKIMS